MGAEPEKIKSSSEGSPLGSIGVIVALVLLVPTILFYAMAPDELLKAGVTIFSDGRQRVYLADPAQYERAGYQDYCVLEPRDELTIVQPPQRPDGSLLARVARTDTTAVPFCPPQADIFVRPHQVAQKQSLWREVHDRLDRLFSR